MIDSNDFPYLSPTNHRITSPQDGDYNCIAWSFQDNSRWWEPGYYWPSSFHHGDYGIATLIKLFQDAGFVSCETDTVEEGFEKVAVYGSTFLYTHAARQLNNGMWTSKLGKLEDIEHHTPHDIAGGVYGEVVEIMKREVLK